MREQRLRSQVSSRGLFGFDALETVGLRPRETHRSRWRICGTVDAVVALSHHPRPAPPPMARRRGATDAAAVEDPFHRQSAKLPVGVFETDRTGDHTWVNERWSEMMGLSSDRAIGRGWLAAVHPDDRARTEAAWYAAIQAEREFVLEGRATASAERAIWVRAAAVPSRDTRGWSVGFVGT